MKLVRYGEFGKEKPGLVDKSGQLRDLSAHLQDFAGDAFSPASLAKIAGLDPARLPAVGGNPRIGAPVGGLPKFIAIGLNYSDHAAEVGMQLPTEPIVFMKANNSLCGPNDAVEKPRGWTKLDWEVELAIIIGTRAKYVTEADALNYVAGYSVCNDVSERFFQLERLGQWTKGKSHDTFVAGSCRRRRPDRRRAETPADAGRRQRQARNWPSTTNDFGEEDRFLPLGTDDADARRRHRHGHAARGRHGHEAAEIPQRRRRGHARHRGCWANSGSKSSRRGPRGHIEQNSSAS